MLRLGQARNIGDAVGDSTMAKPLTTATTFALAPPRSQQATPAAGALLFPPVLSLRAPGRLTPFES